MFLTEVSKKGKTIDSKLTKTSNGFDDEKLKLRIDYAEYLLVQTAEPLDKIASDCGWTSVETFIAVFQKIVGVTPLHYRNWHRE